MGAVGEEATLRWTAGKVASRLDLPDHVAKELRELVHRRNRLAHHAILEYRAARQQRGLDAVPDWGRSFEHLGVVFNEAFHRLLPISEAIRLEPPGRLPSESKISELWRPPPLETPHPLDE